MRYLVLALALLPAAAIAGENDIAKVRSHLALPAKPAAQCENARTNYASPAAEPVKMRTLRQQPLASLYLGVLRMEDGCDKPVKIADGVGDKQR